MATTTKKTTTKKKSVSAKSKKSSAKSNSSKKKTTTKKSLKTTTKIVSKKSLKITEAKSSNRKSKSSQVFDKLNVWNWVVAVILAAQAVAVIALSNDSARSFVAHFVTSNPLIVDDSSPVVLVATRSLFNVQISYFIAAILIVGAVYHTIAASMGRKRFEDGLTRGVSAGRWIETGISGGLMLMLIGLFSGVTDVTTSKMMFVLAIVSATVGYTYERSFKGDNRLVRHVSVLAGLAPWVFIGSSYVFTYKYGDGGIPGYIFIMAGGVFAASVLSMITDSLYDRKKGGYSDYTNVEWNHMALSLISKTLVAWVLYNNILS